MKAGIDLEESHDIVFNGVRVPPEVLGYILEHVGEARFIGSHSLMTVCKSWNPAFNLSVTGEKFVRKGKNASNVLRDCQQDLTNAIFILSDKKTRSHLRLSEILTVAFHHKEFAHAIWKSGLINGSNVTEVIKYFPLMCKHKEVAEEIYDFGDDHNDSLFMYYAAIEHLDLAQKFFDDDRVRQNLTPPELIVLGSAHLEITKRILADPHLMNTLTFSPSALRKLCVAHAEIAAFVLADPDLNATLTGKSLAAIGAAHLGAARTILTNAILRGNLESGHLTAMGLAHAEIANIIFANDDWLKMLSAEQQRSLITAHIDVARDRLAKIRYMKGSDEKLALLRTIMHAHPEIDIEIWYNITLREILEIDDLVSLALAQERIACSLWNNKSLLSTLTVEQQIRLAEKHRSIALEIVKDEPLIELRKKSLARLGVAHSKVAQKIWKKEDLRKELNNDELFALSIHESIALDIWQSESLRRSATDEQIREIANHNIMVAREIVADEVLCKKLSNKQLRALSTADVKIADLVFERLVQRGRIQDIQLIAQRYEPIALKLIQRDELTEELATEQLQALGVAHAEVAKLILSDEALRELLNEEELSSIIKAHPAAVLSTMQEILAGHSYKTLSDNKFLHSAQRLCDIFSLSTNKNSVRSMIDDALPENRMHLKGELFENKLLPNMVRAIFKLAEVNFPLNKPFAADSVIPQRSFFPCVLM